VVDARFLVDLGQHVTSSLQKWRGSSPIDQEARYRHRGTASKYRVVDQSASIGSAW
jgi:hypothetical protein